MGLRLSVIFWTGYELQRSARIEEGTLESVCSADT